MFWMYFVDLVYVDLFLKNYLGGLIIDYFNLIE